MTIDTLIEHFNLAVKGYKFSTEDIWNVVGAASAQGQAIESTANQMFCTSDPHNATLCCCVLSASVVADSGCTIVWTKSVNEAQGKDDSI